MAGRSMFDRFMDQVFKTRLPFPSDTASAHSAAGWFGPRAVALDVPLSHYGRASARGSRECRRLLYRSGMRHLP